MLCDSGGKVKERKSRTGSGDERLQTGPEANFDQRSDLLGTAPIQCEQNVFKRALSTYVALDEVLIMSRDAVASNL